MNLTEIKLSQRSQTWKSTLYYNSICKNKVIYGSRGKITVTSGRGRHVREDPTGVFCDAGNGLYFDLGGGYMVVHICKNLPNCTYDFVDFAIHKLRPIPQHHLLHVLSCRGTLFFFIVVHLVSYCMNVPQLSFLLVWSIYKKCKNLIYFLSQMHTSSAHW